MLSSVCDLKVTAYQMYIALFIIIIIKFYI